MIAMELPVSGFAALVVGGALFLSTAFIAFFAFRMLQKSVKMAFRLAMVAGFLIIATVGTFSLWWFATAETPKPKPKAARTR